MIASAAEGIAGQRLNIHRTSDWPAGLSFADVEVVSVRALEAMLSPAFATQAFHMVIAAFAAVGLGVAGVHAFMLGRDPQNPFHRRALRIALPLGFAASVAMPLSGDFAAKHVARHQPVKLAAMEGHWHTERGAALLLGGIPSEAEEETFGAIRIPKLLSIMAFSDPNAEVVGLRDIPREDRPPVAVVHIAFQIMVGVGFLMIGVSGLALFLLFRNEALYSRPRVLRLLAWSAPLGFIAIEAGWTVTEVGRQPWIVRSMMRTAEAVTPMPHLIVPMTAFAFLYTVLAVVCFAIMRHHVIASPSSAELSARR
ncbi:MAG: cytochrome ubiquinol oxidase subunit I [Deltaproteobacteria bacterium]|nr:cytochrome ubiquinol oxidase subunit I [Deltaproteobacteria bacterium]